MLLPRDQWSAAFDAINHRLQDDELLLATLEIVGDTVGGRESEALPLDAITYERGDDEIAIAMGGRGERFPALLWHFAAHPREVWVLEEDRVPIVITVISMDGTHTILRITPDTDQCGSTKP